MSSGFMLDMLESPRTCTIFCFALIHNHYVTITFLLVIELTTLPMCGFIALIFFRLLLSNCLNWKINCDDHSSLATIFVLFKFIRRYSSHINYPYSIEIATPQQAAISLCCCKGKGKFHSAYNVVF